MTIIFLSALLGAAAVIFERQYTQQARDDRSRVARLRKFFGFGKRVGGLGLLAGAGLGFFGILGSVSLLPALVAAAAGGYLLYDADKKKQLGGRPEKPQKFKY